MKSEFIESIRNCEVCQSSKNEHVQYADLLQLSEIPTQVMKDISMNFIN